MGSNNVKAWGEAVLFAVLAFALTYVTIPAGDYAIALAMLPLVFFSLRRGILLGLVAGIVAGVIQFFVASGGSDILENIVTNIAPFAFVGIAGFFAKFTQRTLNNKRFSNAALNIVTASFFGAIVYFVWKLIIDLFFQAAAVPGEGSAFDHYFRQDGMSFLITFAVTAVVLLVVAKVAPKAFIPRDSRFLSRKEKSKLLND